MTNAPKATSDWTWPARLTLAAAFAMLAWNFVIYAADAGQAIAFPFGLDYGEGIVWQQMRMMLAGEGYGRIDGFPAIVFHYPPLFHYSVALVAGLIGMDELAAARLLSAGSTVMAAGFLAACVARLSGPYTGRSSGWAGGLLSSLIVFTLLPVQSWSFVMRVDMLSLAFSFAGFFFGLRSIARPGAIHVAAVMFVAAIFTKQTAIASPAAVFAILLFVRPRTALAGIATTLGLGLVVLAVLMWATDGRFLRHILFYNINRFQTYGLIAIRQLLLAHCIYVMTALLSIALWLLRLPPRFFIDGGWRGLQRRLLESPSDAGRAMALAYLLLTNAMLFMALKSGASTNYFLEWGCVVALLAGLALTDGTALAFGRLTAGKAIAAMLPLLIAFQAQFLSGEAGHRYAFYAPKRQELVQLSALVKAAPAPVISDNMVSVLRGGKPVAWEPAIFAELASHGVWDERPFIGKIEAHEFAFFVIDGKPGEPLYDSRYSRKVSDAIQTAYPVERRLAGYTLHFPDGSLPAYATSLR